MTAIKTLAGILFVASWLFGCAVGPDYRKPDVDIPPSFNEPQDNQDISAITRWWAAFNDPVLNSLIEQAVASNLDLRIAEARITEVRALYGITDSDYWPKLNAAGSYTRSRTSENAQQGKRAGIPGGTTYNLFQAGFDASWEIDLFGSVRRAVEAADAEVEASVESRRSVLVTLLGDVARQYIELRGLQQQLTVASENIRSQRETLDLTTARYNAGLSAYLDVARAEAQLMSTKSQLPLIEKALKQTSHKIAVLLGKKPGAVWPELSKQTPVPVPSQKITAGLPSDLLLRRPDIRRAEKEVAAASARIGVAVADLFPRFSLTGSFGLQSGDVKDLDSASSRFWSMGPAVRWPIFSGGRVIANIKVQDARYQQTLVRYEQTILTALEDVENALVAYKREDVRREALSESVASNRQVFAMTNELYAKGLIDFLNVLDAERTLLSSENQLVQSETAVSVNIVALYKALGGGWEN